ncbi:response regulator [Kaarinaea lacus]
MSIPSLSKILYVEDEPDIQAVAKLALETVGGFQLEVCSSGSEALEKGPSFSPDLILIDVMMPGMDGPTTVKALKEMDNMASVPVIFITAKVQQSEIEQLKQVGAIEVIAKPFDPMTLSDTVNAIWQNHCKAA